MTGLLMTVNAIELCDLIFHHSFSILNGGFVAGGTFNFGMFAGKRERSFVVLKLAGEPIIGNMASFTISYSRNSKSIAMHIVMAVVAG